MQTEILIVGQGLCGSFLSWWLDQEGISHIIIDEERRFSASRSAAGLINPVTGRRLVKTWMIDELLPFARSAYERLGAELESLLIRPAEILDFFPTTQMRLAFLERAEEETAHDKAAGGSELPFLHLPSNDHEWGDRFQYELGYGMVSPCYLVDVLSLLEKMRDGLVRRGNLLQEKFEPGALHVGGKPGTEVSYKDMTAEKIIFCDGIGSCENSYFSKLPFAPNKGEALIVDIPGLQEIIGKKAGKQAKSNLDDMHGNPAIVFKKGMSLTPWRDDLFWVGSSYAWSFQDARPSEAFRKNTEAFLADWLKIPFTIVDHIASIRPATLERRPFVGFHPVYTAVGILNGMGAKGCSLAPFFAHQLMRHIKYNEPIRPTADVRRFSRLLGTR